MIDYMGMLERGHAAGMEDGEWSKLTYLAECIFNFCTDEDGVSEILATKAVEVCRALNTNSTYEYYEANQDPPWYLIMMNMPFFDDKTDFGVSVRASWWDWGEIKFRAMGICGDGELTEIESFTNEEWKRFIDCVVEFSGVK